MKKCLSVLIGLLCATWVFAIDPGENYFPPPCQGGIFNDVDCPGQYSDWVEEIYNEGIWVGCGGDSFCPHDPATREQVAVAILRSEHRRKILTGAATCAGDAGITNAPNWAICSGTVSDPQIAEGMTIVGTYTTRASDSQIPIRIFDVVDGQFSYEVQTGTSFVWLAAPIVPKN